MTAPVAGSDLALTFRYDQDPGSAFVTDEFRRYETEGHTLLVLADSNGVPQELGRELRGGIFDEIARMTGKRAEFEEVSHAVRSRVTDWFRRTALPPAGCFANVALLQAVGARIRFTGAYAPIYVLSQSAPTRCLTFPGPVFGPPGMTKYPLDIEETEVGPGEHLLIPSDGLLESRTSEGRINGDSHLMKRGEALAREQDVHRAVLDLYADYDAERRDSRSLLTVSRTG